MTLRKLNRPFTFNNDFDGFFNDFFPASKMMEDKKRVQMNIPAVNIKENENSYDISLAAPGMKKEAFNIEIDEGIMTISASEKSETEDKSKDYTRREFNYASFERRFTLPDNLAEEDIKASYEDGVLKIELPKLKIEEQKEKKKQISIS